MASIFSSISRGNFEMNHWFALKWHFKLLKLFFFQVTRIRNPEPVMVGYEEFNHQDWEGN